MAFWLTTWPSEAVSVSSEVAEAAVTVTCSETCPTFKGMFTMARSAIVNTTLFTTPV